ncbi:MAG: tRNA (N6-isopentenyl adenosine(37)-C2)-methylthiotransferase MiaB [Candidatus Omnitrophica bacterium]|nr:tRNA (N6-isopentenyl adenosine(37)-C2)-methylthiotransferase MiaB [Candidatus Omnitrophota bacterium]MCB9721873.1 tRNA (N6-isopentenyl adenosine(37)-C2)-methylthiotransferase MiaB [Candidatus Omnitrophota bacterium]
MNEYDTELVRAILTKADYAFTQDEAQADIIMLNTCAIREHAHRKVYGRVHKILHDRAGVPVKIGILGCMATNLRTELFEDRGLKIDFIAGPDSYKRLPQLISESYGEGKPFDLTLSEFETYSDVYPKREGGVNAWIAVMRGCNNFCTFCVVPYTRGRERSRSVGNIVEEAQRLAADGFKQITLLGQNVNSYRHEEHDFADLMAAVARVKGIERIRFTSPHPKDFPDKFLEVMAAHDNICKQIHLPLQAGSDRILELMNRTYTQEEFLRLVDNIRAKVPGIALSTDVIVGFCTETDEEFDQTLKVMREVEFDSAFMFKYSQRKGTIASRKMEDDVPEAIKTERIVALNELQRDIMEKLNARHVGQTMSVMIEKKGTRKSDDNFLGRADNNKLVTISDGDFQAGDIIPVMITGASPHQLRGVPVY